LNAFADGGRVVACSSIRVRVNSVRPFPGRVSLPRLWGWTMLAFDRRTSPWPSLLVSGRRTRYRASAYRDERMKRGDMANLDKHRSEFKAALDKYEALLVEGVSIGITNAKACDYRKLAFRHYPHSCVVCGFGICAVLQVAHLNCDHSNNDLENLAILCPNCHRMHDLDLISTPMVIAMRDREKVVVQAKLMKDAGAKAAISRAKARVAFKRKAAGQKAAETKKRNLGGVNVGVKSNTEILGSPE
jgi:hypothetical protein